LVSYYSPIEEMYIFVGKDPISLDKDGISVENLNNNRLILRFRFGQESSPKVAPAPKQLESAASIINSMTGIYNPHLILFRTTSFGFYKHEHK
jgi:hypothetical protein